MVFSATRLRSDLYQLLHSVLKTGVPLEIKRKGKTLKIILDEPRSKLENLEKHDAVIGDPEDLANINWSHEWKETKNL